MIFKFVLFILTLFCFTTGNAQGLSVDDLKNTIVAKHSINPDTLDFCDFIVVDGKPYSVADIENGVKIVSAEEIRVFAFADMSQAFHHNKCAWLLVTGSGKNQKNKEKAALVNKLKESTKTIAFESIVVDKRCDDCMAIIVDGKALNEQENIQFISNLKARNIAHIAFYKNANPDFYGYRAKNGMMEILMKDR
jgi:hypothetical protein